MTDCGGADTTPQVNENPMGSSGRGVLIVRELADTYGWTRNHDGHTTVYFEISPEAAR